MDLQGFIYPNEHELAWSILICLYPFITGLVAGAFILASLERVFDAKAVRPTYRLALLTAFAFLLVAPMPLVAHLHQPQRAYEIMATPNASSAMAVFGFVYLWYLMVILLVEIWLENRVYIVEKAQTSKGALRLLYYALSLGVTDTSEKARRHDHRIGTVITILGIPSAVLLHGYVGFIFGSIKANPWWSSVMMPVVFILSAIVSGIALMLLVYLVSCALRRVPADMACVKAMGKYLFYGLLIAFTLEMLDGIHRAYQAEESIQVIEMLVQGRMFTSMFVVQIVLGSIVPLIALGIMQFANMSDRWRRLLSWEMAALVLIGVFAMRWNVVIGGQLFSKSLRGFTIYKLEFAGREGLGVAIALMILPFLILFVLVKLLPPWEDKPGTTEPVMEPGVAESAAALEVEIAP
jgi:Ni/Fe-hydrogenase subunit HybB-like protein